MRQLIGKFKITDSMNENPKSLMVFVNREEGTVGFSLTNSEDTSFAISNMQCGWRGPDLPDNTYEYPTNRALMKAVKEAVNGGVYHVIEEKLFIDII
jgi:hypothetical protein